MTTQDNTQEKHANKVLLATMGIVVLAVAVIAIIGFVFMNRPDGYIEGQVEGTTIRISGKLPGRVVEFYAHEGDTVHAGDTLVHIHSSLVDAQLGQAEAMRRVAEEQNKKIDAGTRVQIVNAAADLVRQAEAAETITRKTYDRMEHLFKEGVISEQKRDEAKAAYDAAVAATGAARSQLSLAKSGAQSEDKASAAAMVSAADSSVGQVEALLEDSYLISPCDGIVDQVYPEPGELVAPGAPIMSVLRSDDRWVTFNVREELLSDLTMGSTIKVMIPALNKKEIDVKIYYIRDMGSYATWRSTKSTGSYDSRTFQIKARPTEKIENLRPGMSVVYSHANAN
ncbi:MAG: HlyD family efflux transporter periplasmic adaptor subunit [Bacteroidales bacterium]|nr:HlyD family efflux transporter periplasmic adaptor subunit [Bacteroidales bacterium]